MNTPSTRRRFLLSGRRRSGAAAVEVAALLPLFLILVLGAIELGRAISVYHTLVEAARAGCRLYCISTELTQNDARAVVDKIMQDAVLDGYSVTFDPAASSNIQHKAPVTVSVSIPFDHAALLQGWFMSGRTLTGTCSMPGDTGDIDASG